MPEKLQRPNVEGKVNVDALRRAGYAPDISVKGLEAVTQDILGDGEQ